MFDATNALHSRHAGRAARGSRRRRAGRAARGLVGERLRGGARGALRSRSTPRSRCTPSPSPRRTRTAPSRCSRPIDGGASWRRGAATVDGSAVDGSLLTIAGGSIWVVPLLGSRTCAAPSVTAAFACPASAGLPTAIAAVPGQPGTLVSTSATSCAAPSTAARPGPRCRGRRRCPRTSWSPTRRRRAACTASGAGAPTRSVDGGLTWTLGGARLRLSIRGLAVDPSTPGRLYVHDGTAICRSTDGGATWQRTAPIGGRGRARPAGRDRRGRAAGVQRRAGRAARSTDAGATWTATGGLGGRSHVRPRGGGPGTCTWPRMPACSSPPTAARPSAQAATGMPAQPGDRAEGLPGGHEHGLRARRPRPAALERRRRELGGRAPAASGSSSASTATASSTPAATRSAPSSRAAPTAARRSRRWAPCPARSPAVRRSRRPTRSVMYLSGRRRARCSSPATAVAAGRRSRAGPDPQHRRGRRRPAAPLRRDAPAEAASARASPSPPTAAGRGSASVPRADDYLLLAHPTRPGVVVALAKTTLYVSRNGGRSFTPQPLGFFPKLYRNVGFVGTLRRRHARRLGLLGSGAQARRRDGDPEGRRAAGQRRPRPVVDVVSDQPDVGRHRRGGAGDGQVLVSQRILGRQGSARSAIARGLARAGAARGDPRCARRRSSSSPALRRSLRCLPGAFAGQTTPTTTIGTDRNPASSACRRSSCAVAPRSATGTPAARSPAPPGHRADDLAAEDDPEAALSPPARARVRCCSRPSPRCTCPRRCTSRRPCRRSRRAARPSAWRAPAPRSGAADRRRRP